MIQPSYLLLRLPQSLTDSIIRKHFIVLKLAFPMLSFIQFFPSIAHYRSNLQDFCILARSIQKARLPRVLDATGIAKLERTEPFRAGIYSRGMCLCVCVYLDFHLYINYYLFLLHISCSLYRFMDMLAQAPSQTHILVLN